MASGDYLFRFGAWEDTPPSSAYPTKDVRNRSDVLDFDAAVDESTYYEGTLPGYYAAGGIAVKIRAMASSATSGAARVGVSWERRNTDQDADSFATEKQVSLTADATSGVIFEGTISFLNSEIDGLLAGEEFRIKFTRDADGTGGTDDMVGDLELVALIGTEV